MTDANAAMREYWNGPGGQRWIKGNVRIENSMAALTQELLAFAAPRAGERVVDIGCGLGGPTLALHERTGAPVLGVDISAPMLDYARSRVHGESVTFEVADATTYAFGRFDLAFSRFGVMFFADPVASFANIRRCGGRLAFACWRPFEQNAWAFVPFTAASPLLPAGNPWDPSAPGPFAFGDPARIRDILSRAGWAGISVEPLDSTMRLGETLDEAVDEAMTIGPLARASAELDDATKGKIRALVRKGLEPIGNAPPAAVWLVKATQP